MGRKRKVDADPGPSSKMKSAATEDTSGNISEPEVSLGRTRSATKELKDLETSGNRGEATSEDWRFNAAVIEAICERLPVKDLKSVRLVCKAWATAGSVPLSHKSVFNPRSSIPRILPLDLWERYIKFDERKKWDTGFRLRHAKLDWTYRSRGNQTKKETMMKSLRPQRLLNLVRSRVFELIVSLQMIECPVSVIDDYLLPYVLPRYWKNLKSLEFRNSYGYGFNRHDWRLPAPQVDAPAPYCPVLRSLKMDEPAGTTWDSVKNCLNLQEVHLSLLSRFGAGGQVESKRIIKALVGKSLKSVVITSSVDGRNDERWRAVWIPLYSTLITMNQQFLRHLSLTVSTNTATDLTSFVDRLPIAQELPHLQAFEFYFRIENQSFVGTAEDRFTPELSQVLFQLHEKGYLQTKSFRLSFRHLDDSLDFVKYPSGTLLIAVELSPFNEFLFPQSFGNILTAAFPNINYVCSPRDRETGGGPVCNTTLFERLGRDGIFDPLRLNAEWKSLEPRSAWLSDQIKCHLYGLFSFGIHSRNTVRRNALLNSDGEDNSRGFLVGRRVCFFDTVPNLSEAWSRIQGSDSSQLVGSTIPEDFIPDVVKDGHGSYAFTRFFGKKKKSA